MPSGSPRNGASPKLPLPPCHSRAATIHSLRSDLCSPSICRFSSALIQGPEDFDIGFDFGLLSQDNGFGAPSSNGTSANALDLAMMRRPLHTAVLQYGKQSPAAGLASHHNLAISPIRHNTISGVFMNTIGSASGNASWIRALRFSHR